MRLNLYGLAIALGVAIAVVYMSREAKKTDLPRDIGMDIALWAVPPAVLFSRVYYVAFNWERYRSDPLSVFRFWEGGLAIYGGVIGGALGVLLLSRRRKIPFPTLVDLVAPGLILAQAIGRWGNFFNGEAYGMPVTHPGFQFFPVAVFVDGQWHMAAFFYESAWNFLGFLFLGRFARSFRRAGRGYVFLWYLIWYGIGRLVIEGLRTDSLMLGTIRVSQWLSLLLVLTSGLLILVRMGLSPLFLLPAAAALGFLVPGFLSASWALLPGVLLLVLFASLLFRPFVRDAQRKGPG